MTPCSVVWCFLNLVWSRIQHRNPYVSVQMVFLSPEEARDDSPPFRYAVSAADKVTGGCKLLQIPDDVCDVICDMLHGPAFSQVCRRTWRRLRGRHLRVRGVVTFEETLSHLKALVQEARPIHSLHLHPDRLALVQTAWLSDLVQVLRNARGLRDLYMNLGIST